MRRSEHRFAAVLARTLREGTRALYRDPAVYDALYRRRRHDVRFYVELAQRHGGPVLELGTGSARVAAAIATAGVEVVGVDAAKEMLARARARIAKLPKPIAARVELRRGDLRKLALGRRFPLVIAPFHTLSHLYAARDLLAALAVCRAHLAPGGRLGLDVAMPDLARLVQDPDRAYAAGQLYVPEHGTRFRLREASHYDALRQIRTTVFLLDPVRGPGTARAIPLTQRQIFPVELEQLLDSAGFEIERRDGDFDGGPLDEASESQVVIARVKARVPVPRRRRR